jgi:hypothetical protein
MAHDRYPPTGYLNCFKPNVLNVIGDKVVVVPRVLSDAEVSECELRPWPPSYGDRFDDPGTLVDYRFVAPAVESFLWQVWPEEPLYIAYLPPYKKTGYPEVDLTEFASYDGLGCHLLPSSEQMLDPEDYAFTLLIADELFGSPSSDAFRPWTEIVAPDASLNSDGYHLAIAAPANRIISQQPGYSLDVNLGGVLRLTGYDLASATHSPGDVLWLTLYMTIEAGAQPSHSLFVHLLGEEYNPVTGGPLWAQDDATPCRGLLPFETHDPGTKIVAKFALPIPETIPPGEYRLATGLYDWQTGERLAPLSSDGDGSVLLDTLNIDE